MYTCKKCGEFKEAAEFYKNSKVRCKKCVHLALKQRYHEKYGPALRASRKAKNHAKKNQLITLPDVACAYAAGLIDGEGSIRITSRGKSGGLTFRQGQYTLIVEMTNTDHGMIKWMREHFGGNVSYSPEKKDRNSKAKWHWRVAADKALYCLDAIWPYIRTKKRQAQLGRRFQRYTQYAGRAVTPKRQKLHERFYQEFRVLNKRGLSKEDT
jgi:hypothetical protein